MKEIFKTVNGFTDYEVSNFGRVRSKARKIRYTHARTKQEHFRESNEIYLKVFYNKQGYKSHVLYLDKKMINKPVHRLVAETFLEQQEGKNVVNHKDGNKHNNTVDNLEWCTDEYNHHHATITGLKPKGESIGSSKLNDNCVRAIKYFISNGLTHKEISKAFNVSRSTITLISLNKIWKHIN